ncbi:MAG: hypothetical protein A2Z32_07345 [Chloroflexi bacterium RBG_16_69_14]|nr:MAG: hypothetical protein A2Z32_07345 [Chloroflexi bacterium RBG_16_69_14]
MSTDRDVTRIVRSWLEEGATALPDRVLDQVLDQLPATRQRRPWWPARRIADMNNVAKLAIAAAAVVVVAVVGINLLPASGGAGDGGPAVSPSPSPALSPSPSPRPSPSPTPAAVFPPRGELAVGSRHSMTLEGVALSFSVPTSDWMSNGSFGVVKSTGVGPDGAGFIFWTYTPTGVFADPCAYKKAAPVGSSTAALAAAVATIPGTVLVSGPTDVTVGGHPAKHVVLTVREDVDCTANSFMLWYAPREDLARYATELGSTIMVWIVDVDGTPVWIDGETYKGAGPVPGQQIQQIVDSIQFE